MIQTSQILLLLAISEVDIFSRYSKQLKLKTFLIKQNVSAFGST